MTNPVLPQDEPLSRLVADLRRQEAKYRRLIDHIPEVVWTADESGDAVFLSDRMTTLFGYTPEENYREGQRLWFGRMHPDDRERVSQAYARLFQQGEPFDVEYRMQHRDGRWMWWHDRAVAFYEENGKRYADGLMSDITERKRAEEDLLHARKMEAIGRLAGGVAHEFNNLLTVITGYTDLLRREDYAGGASREFIEEIARAAARAATLTSQLLAFGRKQMLRPTVIDLNDVIASSDKLWSRLIGEDIQLTLELDANECRVTADEGQIAQVIMNLVLNARDAMPDGGKISIRTATVEFSEAPADLDLAPGRYVRTEIQDTGCGMTPEVLARIFEPFFTTKGVGKGTGLGLSTVYGIVKQSGGDVAVASEVGRGTTCTVFLPAHACVERPVPTGTARLQTAKATVLLVEDEDRVRTLVRQMLEQEGHQVLEARDGVDGLEISRRHAGPIDILLTDLVMPRMNGLELAGRVRQERPNTSVLYMSGYNDDTAVYREVSERRMPLLSKPFTRTHLSEAVRRELKP